MKKSDHFIENKDLIFRSHFILKKENSVGSEKTNIFNFQKHLYFMFLSSILSSVPAIDVSALAGTNTSAIKDEDGNMLIENSGRMNKWRKEL